jgi:hypothetical protein
MLANCFIVMPLRRKIIHDSDCDSPSPPPAVEDHRSMTSPKRCRSQEQEEGVVIILSSDSEDDAGAQPHPTPTPAASQLATLTPFQFAAKFGRFPTPAECTATSNPNPAASQQDTLTPFQFAAKFGRFPTPAECGAPEQAAVADDDLPLVEPAAIDPAPAVVAEPPHVDEGNLWNAVPPRSSQYMDLEAVCMDDDSTGSSDGSDGELSPGFVDDCEAEKENLSSDDVALLKRFFPRTAK